MSRQITEEVLAALRGVDDPELGVSIVDLGLVVSIDVIGTSVSVVLATTSPACPLGALIAETAATVVGDRLGPDYGVRVTVDRTVDWSPEDAVPEVRSHFERPPSRILDALRSGLGHWKLAR
jgi:metal-sulfur cluster biosynthetic enzyme